MRTLKYNGERWYVDERSLWKRCRQWLVWIGGWEKANGAGWQFTLDLGNRKKLMNPTPISLFGHAVTFFGWGGRIRLLHKGSLTWSESGIYVSQRGTPRFDETNKGFFILKRRLRHG